NRVTIAGDSVVLATVAKPWNPSMNRPSGRVAVVVVLFVLFVLGVLAADAAVSGFRLQNNAQPSRAGPSALKHRPSGFASPIRMLASTVFPNVHARNVRPSANSRFSTSFNS